MAVARLAGRLAAVAVAVAASGGPLRAMGWTEWPGPAPGRVSPAPDDAHRDGWIDVDGLTTASNTADGAGPPSGRAPGISGPAIGAGVFAPFRGAEATAGRDGDAWVFSDPLRADGRAYPAAARSRRDEAKAWTRKVVLSELNFGSSGYVELVLAPRRGGVAAGRANGVFITDMEDPAAPAPAAAVGVGPDDRLFGPLGNRLLDGDARRRVEDTAAGSAEIGETAAICACPGQGGAGRSDLVVTINKDVTGDWGPSDSQVFYAEYLYLAAGFEQWGLHGAAGVAEPGTLVLLVGGLAGLHVLRRRRRRTV